ncbi:glycosyltransferase family 2 protein [Pseudonocardia spinosispora]|uniref:glycosyltransferase family 2 protein n=1 Tax=Pseudonocardia spinosispora TaxID=103441 RepID=UPI0003FBF472|nr:galactosyltransferase-related protein [Pseudonocardia spinosispora]
MSARLNTVVITIARGRETHLHRQRLALAADPPGHHVIVGMGETPALKDVPGAPPTVVLQVPVSPAGLPLAAARNAGAAEARGLGAELLVLLDIDCIPEPGLLDRYAHAATVCGHPALLCGPVAYLPPAGPDGYPVGRLASLAGPHPARPVPPDRQLWPESRFELFWSLSFAMTVRDWSRLGGFCEEYTGYGGEDTDFALTASAAGAYFYWVGGALAYHQHHPPSRGSSAHVAEIVRNAHTFHRRWGRWPMVDWLHELAADGQVRFAPERSLLELGSGHHDVPATDFS